MKGTRVRESLPEVSRVVVSNVMYICIYIYVPEERVLAAVPLLIALSSTPTKVQVRDRRRRSC